MANENKQEEGKLKQVFFGNTGLKVRLVNGKEKKGRGNWPIKSELCLGAMTFGKSEGWKLPGQETEQECYDILNTFYDVRFFTIFSIDFLSQNH